LTACGGGVIKETEVMIWGFEKKTASDLSVVIVRLAKPMSALYWNGLEIF
jgi:hypothetical protein